MKAVKHINDRFRHLKRKREQQIQQSKANIKNMALCPITCEEMLEPTVIASGHSCTQLLALACVTQCTLERNISDTSSCARVQVSGKAIKKHFRVNGEGSKCPVSNQPVSSDLLAPNHAMRQLLSECRVLGGTAVEKLNSLAMEVIKANRSDVEDVLYALKRVEENMRFSADDAVLSEFVLECMELNVCNALNQNPDHEDSKQLSATMTEVKRLNGESEKCMAGCITHAQQIVQVADVTYHLKWQEADRLICKAQTEQAKALDALAAFKEAARLANNAIDAKEAMSEVVSKANDDLTNLMDAVAEINSDWSRTTMEEVAEPPPCPDWEECYDAVLEVLSKKARDAPADGSSQEIQILPEVNRYLWLNGSVPLPLVTQLVHRALYDRDPIAMALCYDRGLGDCVQDDAKARKLLDLLCALSEKSEVAFLMYEHMKRDSPDDVTHLKKAAEQGLACAELYMSWHLETTGEKDEALIWFDKAMNRGFPSALTEWVAEQQGGDFPRRAREIAEEQEEGDEEDEEWLAKRAKWKLIFTRLKQACDQGNQWAQFHLAFYYKYGIVTNKDVNRATQLFRKAAETHYIDKFGKLHPGFVPAMYHLALMLGYTECGLAASKIDKVEAARWMVRAKGLGCKDSECYLSRNFRGMAASVHEAKGGLRTQRVVKNASEIFSEVERYETESWMAGRPSRF